MLEGLPGPVRETAGQVSAGRSSCYPLCLTEQGGSALTAFRRHRTLILGEWKWPWREGGWESSVTWTKVSIVWYGGSSVIRVCSCSCDYDEVARRLSLTQAVAFMYFLKKKPKNQITDSTLCRGVYVYASEFILILALYFPSPFSPIKMPVTLGLVTCHCELVALLPSELGGQRFKPTFLSQFSTLQNLYLLPISLVIDDSIIRTLSEWFTMENFPLN